jgi:AcrR family transcriptional regulator
MVVTPWGNSEDLHRERLAPGPGRSAAEAAANQRRRLLGAMVASVAEKGYAETGVADLSAIAGVSPRSFYQHFENKEACFLAALEGVLSLAVEHTLSAPQGDEWRQEARNRIVAFASFVAEQPSAARMFLVEAYAAGPLPAQRVDEAIKSLERTVKQRLDEVGLPASMPSELVIGAIGATMAGARIRLLRGHLQRLPEFADELASFLLQFEPPARPLRVAARPPAQRQEEREAGDHAERALRAFEALLAEHGLARITMGQVAERAKMSVRTLYANFAGREELMLAAVDAAAMQAVAAMLPAYRRGPSPAEGVRAAFSALFGMLASRPNLAHLLLAGTREGGGPTLERRTEVLRQIEPLLSVGVPAHKRPVSIRVASEALLNAVLEVGARRLADSGADSLPALVPICSFMILAPVLGTEQATAAAEGKSYRKPSAAVSRAVLSAGRRPSSDQLLIALSSSGPRTAAELEETTLLSAQQVADQIRTLEKDGAIAAIPPSPDSDQTRYAAVWGQMDTEESLERPQAEREALTLEVGQVIKAEVEEAVEAGTFDARADRSLVRLPLWLDDQGWRELSKHLDDSLAASLEIQRRASERLLTGGDPKAGTYGRLLFATFEVPRDEDLGS